MNHDERSQSAPAPTRWGFIGSGQMATALALGMIRGGAATPGTVRGADPSGAARARFAAETGAVAVASNAEVIEGSDAVILAVKPQGMAALLGEVAGDVGDRHLIISVAAGVTLAGLAAGLGPGRRLARVMPNTPALVGEGASAFCLGPGARPEDEATVRACVESVGRAERLPEHLLDAVTGLSGSGPAFVFIMIEAMADGGVKAGLPRDVALRLAAQTVLGSAAMVLQTGEHPGLLKDRVASPGGTTIAGLHALERGGVRAALIDAVEAAARRSAELSAQSGG